MRPANAALRLAGILLAAVPCLPQKPSPQPDVVLQAMTTELQRAKALRIVGLDVPYFIEYALDDAESYSVSASLGALVSENQTQFRVPRIQVRVGSYQFDNTNYVFTDYFTASHFSRDPVPLDNDLLALRTYFWLATDRAYKGAVAALARKRAALKGVTVREELPDFSPAEPARMTLPPARRNSGVKAWATRARVLSGIFARYPKIVESEVQFESVTSNTYLANSEGTLIRHPDNFSYLQVRAEAQAPDGMILRDATVAEQIDLERVPSDLDLRRAVQRIAENLSALADTPMAESYYGPVLFEGQASPQMFAQLLGDNLALPRRPVPEPGRPVSYEPSELEGRIGSLILPEWMDVVDDPTQEEWRGQPLIGHYVVDLEGVVPKPLQLVEKGFLKDYLLTRQPVKGMGGSNGRARLPGRFGAKSAALSNLFVSASRTVSAAALRQKAIDLCRQRNKPFGIVIRKLDFPSTARLSELRQLAAGGQEGGAGGKLFSSPVLAYRLYPDGREELVRGLRFRRLSVRSLRDIIAASDESHLFSFIGSNAPLSMLRAGGFVIGNSVVAPSILFEDLELDTMEEELPKLPVVPPPELTASE